MIKWFGIIILATRFEFGDRSSLWSSVFQSKYRSDPAFGKTGMNSHRFDMLWRHVLWSHQPDVRGEGTSHEAHLWKLVEDLVTHLMSIAHIYSFLPISYVLMSPYRSGTGRVVIGSIFFANVCGNEAESMLSQLFSSRHRCKV